MVNTIYYNGQVITVDENFPEAEAVAIENGLITKVGCNDEVLKLKIEDTKLVDLKGKVMLPGFIDGHSHLTGVAKAHGFQNLFSPPIGSVKSMDDIKAALAKFREERQIEKGQWILGLGYDESSLKEKRHPNKYDLDEVSTENPVLVLHASIHMGSLNSKALEVLGISSETPNPEGGVIERVKGSDEPNGYIEETALRDVLVKLPKPTPRQALAVLDMAQDTYLSNGITTVQDGMVQQDEFNWLVGVSQAGKLKLDVVGYAFDGANPLKETLLSGVAFPVNEYENNLKFGGAKLVLDGSPQGKTAWMTEPYLSPPDGKDEDYKAYPTCSDDEVYKYFMQCQENNWQVLVHCNGDAAADQFIRCYEESVKDTESKNDLRPVMIHAQTVREDQLDKMNALGIMPSYFVDHTYYWGDAHVQNLGMKRAERISPLASTIKRDMKYTLHQDAPVVPPNMLLTLWAAVNRKTASGEILGADQKISVMEAIKGITINGAYQYFEEDVKGSITVGKKADLVILDKNPLSVSPDEIKDIQVLETIKDGKTLYMKK